MDKIRNEYVRGTNQAAGFQEKVKEARLKWLNVQQRVSEYTGQTMLNIELESRRKRPQKRLDAVIEDMQRIGVTQEDARDRMTG